MDAGGEARAASIGDRRLGRGRRSRRPRPGTGDRVPLLARMVAFPLTVDVRSGAVSGIVELLADRRLSPNGQVAVAIGPGQGEQIVQSVGPALGQRRRVARRGRHPRRGARRWPPPCARGSYDAWSASAAARTLDVAK